MGPAPGEVVRAVTAGVSRLVDGRLSRDEREEQLDQLADLYAEHTDVRHPFAPFGDSPMCTRDELRAHFETGTGQLAGVRSFEVTGMIVHQTADPEVVVAEFQYSGSTNGGPFELPGVFVVRVRDGRIAGYPAHLHGHTGRFGRWSASGASVSVGGHPHRPVPR